MPETINTYYIIDLNLDANMAVPPGSGKHVKPYRNTSLKKKKVVSYKK